MWKDIECEYCSGAGETICDRCGGSGSLPGFATFGGGFTACDVCYGSGYVPCLECNGDGYIEVDTEDEYDEECDDEYDEDCDDEYEDNEEYEYGSGYSEDRGTKEDVIQSSKQRMLKMRESAFGIKTEIENLYQSNKSTMVEKYLRFKDYSQSTTVANILNPNNFETFDDKEYIQSIWKYLFDTIDILYNSLSDDVKSMLKKAHDKEEELKVENGKVFYRPFPPTEPKESNFDETYTVQKPIKPVGYYKSDSKQKEQDKLIGEKNFGPKYILFEVLWGALIFSLILIGISFNYWFFLLIAFWLLSGLDNDILWIAFGVYLVILMGSVGFFLWEARKEIIAYASKEGRKEFYKYEVALEKYTHYEQQLNTHKAHLKKYPDDLEKYKTDLEKYTVDLEKYKDDLEKHEDNVATLTKEIDVLYKRIHSS